MKVLAANKRAYYDYDFKDTFEAGLVLSGAEVKSVRHGNVSLQGSFVKVYPQRASLVNAHIGPYAHAPQDGYDPTQSRDLLLSKSQILQLLGKEKGLVIVPLEIYSNQRGWLKLKVAIGRPRKKVDKREYIKERDAKREARMV